MRPGKMLQEIASYLAQEQDKIKAREEGDIRAMPAREVGD